MWAAYLALVPDAAGSRWLADQFCDNAADANELAALVVADIKRATASSVAELHAAGEPVPKPGDHLVVLDGSGKAQCVVRTTQVDMCRFGDVSAEFAAEEGEGNGSLAYWRRVHRAYYARVLAGTGIAVDDDLLIACERFERVYPPADATKSP